uniref:Uncharacterized protein n=1 Tax=Amphimedon queenslandica TaxID=400682 RepID=A0A1X7UBR0_AMPQE
MDLDLNVIVIGEVSHDKPDDRFYQLLGAMLRVYLETGLLSCGMCNAHFHRRFGKPSKAPEVQPDDAVSISIGKLTKEVHEL